MRNKLLHTLTLFVFLSAVIDAHAGRRTLRIDFGDWEESGCEGTGVVRNGVVVEWSEIVFAGIEDPAYLVDTYCQETIPGNFSDFSFFEDEQGMAELVGANEDNAVTGVRQTLLDRDRFVAQKTGEGGFQWAFYFFPDNIVIVALYGLIEDGAPIPLTDTSYIKKGAETYWQGDIHGFDGEYFCFIDGEYFGTWDGEPVGPNPLLACLSGDIIMDDSFE